MPVSVLFCLYFHAAVRRLPGVWKQSTSQTLGGNGYEQKSGRKGELLSLHRWTGCAGKRTGLPRVSALRAKRGILFLRPENGKVPKRNRIFPAQQRGFLLASAVKGQAVCCARKKRRTAYIGTSGSGTDTLLFGSIKRGRTRTDFPTFLSGKDRTGSRKYAAHFASGGQQEKTGAVC